MFFSLRNHPTLQLPHAYSFTPSCDPELFSVIVLGEVKPVQHFTWHRSQPIPPGIWTGLPHFQKQYFLFTIGLISQSNCPSGADTFLSFKWEHHQVGQVGWKIIISIYLFICLSMYLFIYLSIYLYIYLSIYLSIYPILQYPIIILSYPILSYSILSHPIYLI